MMRTQPSHDDVRKAAGHFAIAELLIGNVVIGNYTVDTAYKLACVLGAIFRKQQENNYGAGI